MLAQRDTGSPWITTTIEHEPRAFFAQLRDGTSGKCAPWDLVTVNALRWRMEAQRYEAQRAEWRYVVDPLDIALLDTYVRGGGGLLALHTAVICFDADPLWHELTGATWNWDRSLHPEVGWVRVSCLPASAEHPITAGVGPFDVHDEVYGFLDESDGLVALLTGTHGGRDHPLLWARAVGDGRVVTDLLGHGVESLTHATHRAILRRAAAWATGDR